MKDFQPPTTDPAVEEAAASGDASSPVVAAPAVTEPGIAAPAVAAPLDPAAAARQEAKRIARHKARAADAKRAAQLAEKQAKAEAAAAKKKADELPGPTDSDGYAAPGISGRPRIGVSVAELRKRRLRALGLRVSLGSLLPTLVAMLYLALVASPQYQATASFTIEASDGGMPSGLEAFAGASMGAAMRDTILAREQIVSEDLVAYLVEHHGFVEHYGARTHDPFYRLPAGASREDIYDYFMDLVEAEFDWQTGVVTVRVLAFTRRDARRICEAILQYAEVRMNERGERLRRDSLAVAERQVDRAQAELEEARVAVSEVRAASGQIDPASETVATVGIRSQVEIQLSSAQAELIALMQSMQPNAPQVLAARARVNGLAAAVARHDRQIVAEGRQSQLTRLEVYEPAQLRKEIAQRALEASIATLEAARLSNIRQHRYLVRISGPLVPGEATHPEVFLDSLTVLVGSLSLVAILSLIVASVREHANV